MKKRIIAITAGTFMTLVSSIAIVSCNKNEHIPVANEAGQAHYSKNVSITTDLEHFGTRFLTKEDGSQTVVFAEPEDIPFLPEDAKRLGFEELTISKGIYEIQKDAKGHSKVTFALSKFSGVGTTMSVGIRIADRYRTHCGTSYGEFVCICGIGFRCGIVSGINEPAPFEDIPTIIYPAKDVNGKIIGLTFEFQKDNIDWKVMDGIATDK